LRFSANPARHYKQHAVGTDRFGDVIAHADFQMMSQSTRMALAAIAMNVCAGFSCWRIFRVPEFLGQFN
jgi:hypothetical protein